MRETLRRFLVSALAAATLVSCSPPPGGQRPSPSLDLTPPDVVQVRVVYSRVSDNFEVGNEVVQWSGFTRANIARDRAVIVAVTAGDNESGVNRITYAGDFDWDCMVPGAATATNQHATLSGNSDEVVARTAAPGSPPLRTAHFTLDPFSANPRRLVCGTNANQSPVTASLVFEVWNGANTPIQSGPYKFVWLARPAGP